MFGALGLLPEFGERLHLTKATGYLLVAVVNAYVPCLSMPMSLGNSSYTDVIGPFDAIISVMLVESTFMLALWLR